jgi:hypothetical protein
MTADTTDFCDALLGILHTPCWTVHSIHTSLIYVRSYAPNRKILGHHQLVPKRGIVPQVSVVGDARDELSNQPQEAEARGTGAHAQRPHSVLNDGLDNAALRPLRAQALWQACLVR